MGRLVVWVSMLIAALIAHSYAYSNRHINSYRNIQLHNTRRTGNFVFGMFWKEPPQRGTDHSFANHSVINAVQILDTRGAFLKQDGIRVLVLCAVMIVVSLLTPRKETTEEMRIETTIQSAGRLL